MTEAEEVRRFWALGGVPKWKPDQGPTMLEAGKWYSIRIAWDVAQPAPIYRSETVLASLFGSPHVVPVAKDVWIETPDGKRIETTKAGPYTYRLKQIVRLSE